MITDIELTEELMDEGRCCRTSRARCGLYSLLRIREIGGKVDAVYYSQTICAARKRTV